MRLAKQFDVDRSRDEVVEIACREDTLTGLFPDAKTEIVERARDRITTRTTYRALGREGVATFHFSYLLDGGIRFEKVCDGRVWRRLTGSVSFEEHGDGTRVQIELDGRTRPLVPELAIRGAMQQQIEQMADALRGRVESD